ncbi:unnamed protein product [Peronospora destructor]|uniref:Uncharacterized protein n=1 Tax=Peronospora destructor TaxID=86335 RepID=A0AAV0TVY3_9STRA|nr:unnamed protein product [Peronospora destructor]
MVLVLQVQLVMFVVYAMAQTCLHALQFACILMCFPAELYGTLQAFLAAVSFSFGLLNYVINPWTQLVTTPARTSHHATKARAESAGRNHSLSDENTRLL